MSPATQIAANPGSALPEAHELIGVDAGEHTARLPLPKRVKTQVMCPKCKSPKIRFSSSFTVIDGLLGLVGLRALRCHSCYCKFHRMLS